MVYRGLRAKNLASKMFFDIFTVVSRLSLCGAGHRPTIYLPGRAAAALAGGGAQACWGVAPAQGAASSDGQVMTGRSDCQPRSHDCVMSKFSLPPNSPHRGAKHDAIVLSGRKDERLTNETKKHLHQTLVARSCCDTSGLSKISI